MNGTITCKVCDAGVLQRKKKYRMSMPVVVIGWVFLVPSFIGMLLATMMMFSTCSAMADVSNEFETELRTSLAEAGVPGSVASDIVAGRDVPTTGMSPEQVSAVESAEMSYQASLAGVGIGAGVGGGISIFMFLFSMCGGLLGWLLTMKKKVLECRSCEAVVAAQ